MNVQEFNTQYAANHLSADPQAELTILSRSGSEWRVKIADKVTWVKVRKEKQLVKSINYNPQTTLPLDELSLDPSTFKLLHWIRHIDGRHVSLSHAANQLHLSVKTIRKAFKELIELGKVKAEIRGTQGYELL
jgi:porphobilinogen deaminase